MKYALLAVFLALPVLAEEPTHGSQQLPVCTTSDCPTVTQKPAPVPQITTEQKLDYQRARANMTAAREELARTTKFLEDSIAAMQKTCGSRQVITDAKGDPMCEVKDEKK